MAHHLAHHCPFPVRSTDSRRCYRTGSMPGFTLCLALVAALSGYASFSHAAADATSRTARSGAESSRVAVPCFVARQHLALLDGVARPVDPGHPALSEPRADAASLDGLAPPDDRASPPVTAD